MAALVVGALLGTGCTPPPGRDPGTDDAGRAPDRAPTTSVGASARWRACPELAREIAGRPAPGTRYDCATVTVPRDWPRPAGPAAATTAATVAGPGAGAGPTAATTPTGRSGGADPTGAGGDTGTMEIALLRARAGDQRRRIGALLVNPGGPGGSGIETAVHLSFGPGSGGLPREVLRRFDVVGFDPRGVGRSSPVDCIDDRDLDASFGADPDPVEQRDFDALVALNRRIGDRCAARYGADGLARYATVQAARDMDAVRAAVGDDKLTYLGYSYGTLLGATYAQLFPHRVRALVLDGAVDPGQDMVAASEGQARGFEQAFRAFAAWCRRTPARCPIGPDAAAAARTALAKARVSPARGRDGREATAGWVFYAIVAALYAQGRWPQLAAALDELAGGDPATVFALADAYADRDRRGRYSNMFDAFVAVSCADEEVRPTPERVRALQRQWRDRYPLFGGALATGLLACGQWPGRPDRYPAGPATGAPPILVIGTVGDPATPYEQAPRLARMLGVGRLLTWEGEGHTAYPETACVTRAVNAYLIDLTAPRDGLRCPPA